MHRLSTALRTLPNRSPSPAAIVRLMSTASSSPRYEWCVIGAGPAGIAAVGQLLDHGVPAQSLVWLDQSFTVGDFGTKWREVSSNTTVRLFTKFYRTCKHFHYHGTDEHKQPFAIESLPQPATCELELAAQPLRHITRTLRLSVTSVQCTVQRLSQAHQSWLVHTDQGGVEASNVVLAIGSEPSTLAGKVSGTEHLKEIPMTVALKPSELVRAAKQGDTVAVFGSSHSAIIIIRELLGRGVKVVNIYRDPLRYALYLPEFILFDDTGLKGETARWSRENLHNEQLPAGLTRVIVTDTNAVSERLAGASHVIYATGFTRRSIPIDGVPSPAPYNAHCGIIAPGLFGCGIAFPQLNIDRYRNEELRVGLWKFMEYLSGIVPLWMQYSVNKGIGQPPQSPAVTAAATIAAKL